MPVFIIALGAFMLLGGIAAFILGFPYIVLERGFTQVIIGCVVAMGGLLTMVSGLILREIRLSNGPSLDKNTANPDIAAVATSAAVVALAAAAALTADANVRPVDDHNDENQPLLPFLDGSNDETLVEAVRAEAANSAAGETTQNTDQTADENLTVENDIPDEWAEAKHQEAASELRETDHITGALPGSTPAQPERYSPDNLLLSDSYDDLRQSLKAELGMTGAVLASQTVDEVDVKDDDGPAASDEGIISVKQIGTSTYTMFADGSVQAQSPDGARMFASIAELKEHLANTA